MIARRAALTFRRGESAQELSHAQALGAWEAALAATTLPLQLTDGRRPRPRFALVAQLPIGYTSDCEVVELFLTGHAPPETIVSSVNLRMPSGMLVTGCDFLPDGGPSLRSQLRWAEYRLTLGPVPAQELEGSIDSFFSAPAMPWREQIEGKVKEFDLRALVDDLWVEVSEGGTALGMRLDASANGTGRPDSVVGGLGLPEPLQRHRTRLLFAYLPQAIVVWRRSGRFESTER